MSDFESSTNTGTQKQPPRWSRLLSFAGLSLLCTGSLVAYLCKGGTNPSPMTFDGTCDQLQQTLVVPTLDSPIPEGNSVIWCSSFQLAWNRLKDDLATEPVRLENAQPIADRLNNADQSKADPDTESVYAAAGFAEDGIAERIEAEMERKFPNVPTPHYEVPENGAVAYSYLTVVAKFDYPFFENDGPFVFTDVEGKTTKVGSFGIHKKDAFVYYQLRRQVQVLYLPPGARPSGEVAEFIVDLCHTSQPNQIVLARIDRKATLAETLIDIEQKIAKRPAIDEGQIHFGPNDTLLIPNMDWKVTHRFKELEGTDKQFLNQTLHGKHLETALQTIQFRLGRNGAELASESKISVRSAASHYLVNRPFLIYMKKRDCKQPFFVAWIENVELLERR